MIAIKNDDNLKNITIEVSRNTIYFKKINFNEQVNDRVGLGEFRTYSIDVMKKGTLDVTLSNCLGYVILYSTSNRNRAMNQYYSVTDRVVPYRF